MTFPRFPLLYASSSLGLLFASAVLLPHALQRLDPEIHFRGIEIMGLDAEMYYAARVRDVFEGHWRLGNAYYTDVKNVPFIQPPLPEWTVAAIGKIFFLNPVAAFVLCKGLFALLMTMVMVHAFAALTHRPWLSLGAVCVLLFANPILNAPWDVLDIINGNLSTGFLRFARPINPQWPVLWFFATVWVLAKWMYERRTWLMPLATLTTLPMLYAYVYAWTYMGVAALLLLLWCIAQRDWPRCRDLLIWGGLTVLCGLPYFWHVWQTAQHPWFLASAMRQGVVASRHVIFGAWIAMFLAMSAFTKRLWPQTWPFIAALAVGGLIALNQQVITGTALVPHHYHWYFIQPLSSVLAMVLVGIIALQYLPHIVVATSIIAVCAFSVALGYTEQVRAYRLQRPQWAVLQETVDVLRFLDQQDGQVVAGAREGFIDDLVPLYTDKDAYATLYAQLFLVSRERAKNTLFFRLWVEGVAPEDADRRFHEDLRLRISSALYAIYYRELTGDFGAIPDDELSELAREYSDYVHWSINKKLTLYPLDVIVVQTGDPYTDALREIQAISDITYKDALFTVLDLRSA